MNNNAHWATLVVLGLGLATCNGGAADEFADLNEFDAVAGQGESLSTVLPSDTEYISTHKEKLAHGQHLVGKLGAGPATENSGIVRSRKHDNLFWMLNDSGNEPRIYAVRRDGTSYRSDRNGELPGTLISGAVNRDWEDIAVMPDGTLIVADVGNNGNARRDVVLYFVAEPEAMAGNATVQKKVIVRYPEQHTFPAPQSDSNYDCESVFTLGDSVYLLTKCRRDKVTSIYRLDDLSPDEPHDLKLLDRIKLGGQAVGADALPDGSKIVVTTYNMLWLFDVEDRDHPLAHPVARLPFKADQVEAVCFDGPDRVLFADEATGLLYKAKLKDFVPFEPDGEAE